MGRYLAARCLVRRGTLSPEPDKRWDFGPLYKAQKELTEILADPNLVEAHQAARSLLHFVRFKTEPEERLAELSKRLLGSDLSETLFGDLWDYVLLLDRLIDCERFTYPCGGRRLVYDRSQDDLTDWIETVQGGKEGATDHALARWREGGGTPWLLAALMKTAPTAPWRDEVLEAAGRIGSDSPAFPAASYHRLRLLLQSGSSETARKLLASLEPSRREEWSRSTKNRFAVFAVSSAAKLFAGRGPIQRTLAFRRLYRAIQSTRHFGGPETSLLSRRAFMTLHRQYPESSWAKKAKYWY